MTTPTRWDQNRAEKRRDSSAGLPRCSRCGRARVFNPCRDCATPTELARTFAATSQGKAVEVPFYPPVTPLMSPSEESFR